MRPPLLVTAFTLTLASVTACGGGEAAPDTKVSFAAAVKSDDAATKACRTLIGDGSKQTWLTSIDTTNGTSVDGTTKDLDGGRTGFECIVSGKGGGSNSFYFVQSKDGYDYEVQDSLDSATTEGHVASAWNASTEVGAVAENARESMNQTATKDLQNIVNQVGK